MREHTRNQKRMYRIHKQEEKILEQELMIAHLQHKVEQLEKENIKLKYLVDDSNTMKAFIVEHNKVEQLENIRKEAIEFMKENCDIITIDKGWIIRSELTTTGLGKLFKILNKGDNK